LIAKLINEASQTLLRMIIQMVLNIETID